MKQLVHFEANLVENYSNYIHRKIREVLYVCLVAQKIS